MTELVWDKAGDRVFQTGIDRGVLYLPDGTAVVWNGLTSVTEDATSKVTPYYLDGVLIYEEISPGDFSGTIKAYTYPDEFDVLMGGSSDSSTPGLSYSGQPSQRFNLSYRTIVGNDIDGVDHGYKLHMLYNLIAIPDAITYPSMTNNRSAIEFSWKIAAVPPRPAGIAPPSLVSGGSGGTIPGSWGSAPGNLPSAKLSIHSSAVSSAIMDAIENSLYGSASSSPSWLTKAQLTDKWRTMS